MEASNMEYSDMDMKEHNEHDQQQRQQDVFDKPILQLKSSVLQAIVEIDFCDISLRQQVIDSLISESGSTFTAPRTYQDFVKLDSRPILHKIEVNLLDEVKNACILLRNPYKTIVDQTDELSDAIKLTEAAIRRLIKMSKRLSAFNHFSQSDQISLLKGSVVEMMCIRCVPNCVYQKSFWYFIDDKKGGVTIVDMNILKSAEWINVYKHKAFAQKFNMQFPDDMMLVDLLTIIILFRPSRQLSTNNDLIREQFLNFCYLLKRYLYAKHRDDPCQAKTAFIALMHRLEELYYLSEDIIRLYLDMDPENAGPLFIELFDLK